MKIIFFLILNFMQKTIRENTVFKTGNEGLSFYCRYTIFKVSKQKEILRTTSGLTISLNEIKKNFKYDETDTSKKTPKNSKTANIVLKKLHQENAAKIAIKKIDSKTNSGKNRKLISKKNTKHYSRKLNFEIPDTNSEYQYQVEISCGMNEFRTLYTLSDTMYCNINSQFFRIMMDVNDKRIMKQTSLQKLFDKRTYKLSEDFKYNKRLNLRLLPVPQKNSDECEYIFSSTEIVKSLAAFILIAFLRFLC